MLAELDEALPFDEPLHEYGFQLDGSLRRKWLGAYLYRRDKFAYNGDEYRVFDPKGRPLAPQVCVDFLTDTLERTSGTWYVPRGDTPHRQVGKLDFDALVSDRQEMRRVPGFVGFAKSHPEWFEVTDGKRSSSVIETRSSVISPSTSTIMPLGTRCSSAARRRGIRSTCTSTRSSSTRATR